MKSNKEKRPELHIPLEPADIVLEAVSAALMIALLSGSVLALSELPERIPMQFDLSGNPTRWGGQGEFIVLPVLSLVMWGMMTILSRYPHIYNYTQKVTAENAFRLYRTGVRFIRMIKTFVVGLFTFIQWTVFKLSIGEEGLPEQVMLPLALGIPVLALVYYFWQQRAIKQEENHG